MHEPGRFDPVVAAQFARWWGPIVRRMWPADWHGLEHVPTEHHRWMIVANHSGMGIAELWALILGWWERFGTSRPCAGMAHPSAFRIPPIRYFLDGLGAVEATYEGAARAVAANAPLLLFPGGDHEATRPLWQASRVDFAGRKGWIRLAREHGLDIVPLCITGSHATLPILAHGRAVSWATGLRAIGVHRAPLTVLSVAASAGVLAVARARRWPWWAAVGGAVAASWATIPLPWIPSRLGFHFFPPVRAADLGTLDDQAVYDGVVGTLQDKLVSGANPRPEGANNLAQVHDWVLAEGHPRTH